MCVIRRSITIGAPVPKVFGWLTHPEHLLGVWPGLVSVANVTALPGGAHEYDWTRKIGAWKAHGHADAMRVQTDRAVVVHNQAGVPSTWRWTYAGAGDRTELTVELDFTFPLQSVRRVAEAILARIEARDLDALLENVKARLEAPTPGRA